uniref:Uncharacterized protein n=1 Tax=Anguilla anguilla TaxID=7936 RepID=A0A0E9U5P6_ANGAN
MSLRRVRGEARRLFAAPGPRPFSLAPKYSLVLNRARSGQ